MLPNASACSICNERDHRTLKCPQLTEEINRNGFYKPAGGMPQGGDDDDEHMSLFEYYFGFKLTWSKSDSYVYI